MALNEKSMFFDSFGEDRRRYTSAHFAALFQRLFTNGIFRDINPLAVSADGLTAKLSVPAGFAHINGRLYELAEDGTIDVPQSDVSAYYYIVLRLDLSTGARNITLHSKPQGELQRDGTVWELALAKVLMRAGASYIAESDVTDLRSDHALCGYVRAAGDPAYYPPGELPQILWAYAFFPNTLTDDQKSLVRNNPSLYGIFLESSIAKISNHSFHYPGSRKLENEADLVAARARSAASCSSPSMVSALALKSPTL